jgi:hypothetical protein
MTQNNTVALATVSTYDKVNDPMAAATQLGEWIARSGMFGCERVEQGAILAMQCLVERKAPLELAKHYHIIGGKLSLRADAMLALYRERGGKVRWLQFDDNGAKARWTYDGNDIELGYSAEDARRAGFLPGRAGSGWAKFPAEMMRARLISKAVRMLAPEVCTGTYTPEELEDIQRPSPTTVAVGVTTSSIPAPVPAAVAVEVNVAEAEVVPAENELTPQKQVFKLLTDADLLHVGRAFLQSKNWIPEDGNLSMLSAARAAKILAKPEAFLAAVKSAANTQPATE